MDISPNTFDRHDRANSLIKEIVANFIQQEADSNPLITVTNVTISPDYHQATIFFTTIPSDREADALIFLKRQAKEMRGFVKKKSKLKIIPYLEFSVDYGERHRQHIDEIAQEIDRINTNVSKNTKL
ncbi:hypothetical protein COZ82_00465 [Candidatus Kaiserbacteria bacterium CG_4_8_14_3_um_filter_38_9]|uniref:Ribosome-binding factor A n=1 Tax=Candidatus Kaiserbacteria bacterium CG_4_8_14_3_um_filter_38_9 TaxID=1974599 RepID=A0A2M7IPT5_9BACT|nr:ribosome-binding factor A [Candidatus Kaiserbacteria bacterium]PIW97275.1 MAG: hypothetical protein COZ82_00465 [Candidatus Kaiserbacteria bacterium CG_4_8_14_3_um_filter_38_9]